MSVARRHRNAHYRTWRHLHCLRIAASTAIFSIVYAAYLEPLPYRHADRLVMVWSRVNGNRSLVSPADFLDWKRQATSFAETMHGTGGR